MRRVGLALALAVIFAAVSVAAHAHAVLIESRPADGAVLAEPPSEIVLRFNEPIAAVRVRVLDANARPIADGANVETRNDTLRLPLPPLANGAYVVSYRVLSADSHPVGGSIVFTVGDVSAEPRQGAATFPSENQWTTALVVLRALFTASVLLCAGGALALWWLKGFENAVVRRESKVIAATAVIATVAGVLSLGAKGGQLADATALGILDPYVWRLGLASTLATSVAGTAMGLSLILVAMVRPTQRFAAAFAVLGSLVALGSFALTGHAANASPKWLSSSALVVHVVCAAVWLGALHPLLATLRHDPPPEVHAAVRRFSSFAFVSVALLLLAGSTLAVVQVRHWSMLWQSAYGLILTTKIVTVFLLLILATANKFVVMPRLLFAPAVGAAALRRNILVEYILFAGVLVLTAGLSQIEPPRTTVDRDYYAVEQGRGVSASATQAGYRVTLSVAPGRPGHNAIGVMIAKEDGAPVTPKEVNLELSLPQAGIESMRRTAPFEASGLFVHHGNELALAGRWRIDVRILIDDFTERTVTFEVPIR